MGCLVSVKLPRRRTIRATLVRKAKLIGGLGAPDPYPNWDASQTLSIYSCGSLIPI